MLSWDHLTRCNAADNHQSLLLDLKQFATVETDIALWLQLQPKAVLELMHEVAREAVLMQYPEYQDTHNDIFVRTEALVEENIRDLRYATVLQKMLATIEPLHALLRPGAQPTSSFNSCNEVCFS